MSREKLIVIAGPTASGKTALGIALAKKLGGEIVSADSMQIYRGMDIGTAKASAEERGLLEEYGELFGEFGFEIEAFGEREVILRGVPADLRPEDAVPALEEILERLKKGDRPDPRSARDELLHTVARSEEHTSELQSR